MTTADGVLVVGYGNPLRGDDAAGPRTAALLASQQLLPGAQIEIRHQLTPELAHDVAASRVVIFVDATTRVGPGELVIEPVGSARRWRGSHDVEAATILDLADELYGCRPTAFLAELGAQRLDLGDDLSPAVAASLPGAAERIALVALWATTASSRT
jgi:hydrogenase maturation protease